MVKSHGFVMTIHLGRFVGLAIGVLAIPVVAAPSHALVVTIGTDAYDVTTFAGTFNANRSAFARPEDGGQMPWWNNIALARQFRDAVGLDLSLPNYGGEATPFFAYVGEPSFEIPSVYELAYALCVVASSSTVCAEAGTDGDDSAVWAVASPYSPAPPSVPGPVPLLGTATAFSLSRRLRRRISLMA
jgi:hypothetical protein